MGNMKGYSLVEIIISAAIALMTIIAIVTVVRKGGEMVVTDKHRKRARALADSCLESPTYRFTNYVNMGQYQGPVLIDSRDESDQGDDLLGTLAITVAQDTNKAAGTNVPFKRLTVTVTWNEPEGGQAVTLEKLLTPLEIL